MPAGADTLVLLHWVPSVARVDDYGHSETSFF